jgi:ribonuclease R
MAKIKVRYREPLLQMLTSQGPSSLRTILRAMFSKEEAPRMERVIAKELRFLTKTREVERGPGNLYRIRPPRNSKQRAKLAKNLPLDGGSSERWKENEHSIAPLRDRKRSNEKRPPMVGKVSKNQRGFAFVSPESGSPWKEDVFLNPEEAADLLSGDIVEIAVDPRRGDKGYSGALLRILERGISRVVARFVRGGSYGYNHAEVDTKDLQLEISLDDDPLYRDVKDGSAVLVEVTSAPQGGSGAKGHILNVLADSLNSTTDDPHVITKHKLRETFPDSVIKEAEAIPLEINKNDLKGREDLRHLPFVTIDGADARDFDDAVCAELLPNGHSRAWVAVADVAHYVRHGTDLDREAFERGTSVYFPHRVLPMLPERLSNGICSLRPHEDRLAMVAEMEFDATGRKTKQKVYEAVFQSQQRCIYEEVQRFFDRPQELAHDYKPAIRSSLTALYKLYEKLHQIRLKRGAVDLNLPEAKVKVDLATGDVETIYRSERLHAHRLIEEFMIAANEAVTELMEQHKHPFIFRVHESPDPEAAQRFLNMAKALNVKINDRWLDDLTPHTYQKMVHAVEESPASRVLHFLLLRSMKQAFYSAENLHHFGLASKAYSHFTSPIRRYPDLIVHRLLKAWIHKSKKELSNAKGTLAKSLEDAAHQCSTRERTAVDAERELIRIKQVRYAERHLGEEHVGVVIGLSGKGAFLELQDAFIEGFVPIERFGADFQYNESLYHLRGKRTGKIIQIGDKIPVQIVRTNPHLLQIELEPLSTPLKKKPAVVEKSKVPPVERRNFWTPEDFN